MPRSIYSILSFYPLNILILNLLAGGKSSFNQKNSEKEI